MPRDIRAKTIPEKYKWIVQGKPFDPDEIWEGAIERGVKRGIQRLKVTHGKEPLVRPEVKTSMNTTYAETSVFRDVDQKIDQTLQLSKGSCPKFKSKAASDQLTKQGRREIGAQLVREIYDQIEKNWKTQTDKPVPSEKLWVPRRTLEWSSEYKSAEVPLERSAVALFKFYNILRERIDEKPNKFLTWFNQVPVATGIVSAGETRNAIDLVCRTDKGAYDFVELKFPKQDKSSEMPLNAAIEILKNGTLYLFVRRNLAEIESQGYAPRFPDETEDDKKIRDAMPREILEAIRINLCVLAPEYFYYGYHLGWLEDEFNKGLKEFLKSVPVGLSEMTFRFEYLPNRPFEISGENGFRLDFTRRHFDQWSAIPS